MCRKSTIFYENLIIYASRFADIFFYKYVQILWDLFQIFICAYVS